MHMRTYLWYIALLVAAIAAVAPAVGVAAPPTARDSESGPADLRPNVMIFDPRKPQSEIQATVNSIANRQVSNQFGTQRYALLFKPGTYGSSTHPLNFQVGYYTAVAGLGLSPSDVVINGSIYYATSVSDPATASHW